MSKLDFLNRFFLQFFFIRLCRYSDKVIDKFEMTECSITAYGHALSGKYKYKTLTGFAIMYWVKPFSGYGRPYKYIGRPHYKDITKKII
jgi:hypothetical protein